MPKGFAGKKESNSSKAPIITIMAPKGGVGKTTTVLNHGYVLAQ